MDLSEKHRRLVEEIAGDAARAAGIRAADVAASESLGRGCSRRRFQRLPRTLQPRRRNLKTGGTLKIAGVAALFWWLVSEKWAER